MVTINPKHTNLVDLQALLQSAVAPRPIAFASTIDADGHVNLSPFSFFNIFGTNPPTLIFSPNRRVRDGSNKHTYENVTETREVVIHMVDFDLAEQMSLSSCEYPKGVNEFEKAGLTPIPSMQVKPPRIKEAKVAFECEVKQIIEMGSEGGAANLIICEVILMHVSESILDKDGKINPLNTDWIARSGGSMYVRANVDSMFEIPKPNVQLGVGVDQIPENLKIHFSGNELGRLGNIQEIPDETTQKEFQAKQAQNTDFIQLTKKHLASGQITEAWCSLLAI